MVKCFHWMHRMVDIQDGKQSQFINFRIGGLRGTMKRLFSILGLLIVGSTIGYAQRQDTIYETLATKYTTTTPSIGDIWGPVTNIGQGYHQAYLILSNQTGQI